MRRTASEIRRPFIIFIRRGHRVSPRGPRGGAVRSARDADDIPNRHTGEGRRSMTQSAPMSRRPGYVAML